MEKTIKERKRLIYELMNGMLEFKDNPPEECKYVEILNAYRCLCQRLGVNGDEDNDVEIIIDRYETIT